MTTRMRFLSVFLGVIATTVSLLGCQQSDAQATGKSEPATSGVQLANQQNAAPTVQESEKGQATKGEGVNEPKLSTSDEAAVRKAYLELTGHLQNDDYKTASSLMTKTGFDEYFAGKFIEARMMSEGMGPMPGRKSAVLKKYKLDSMKMPENEEQAIAARDLVLSTFKTHDEKLAALNELNKEQGTGNADMMMIDFIGGDVQQVIQENEGIVLKVAPALPMGGPGAMQGFELPEGAEMPEGFEMPEGAEMMGGPGGGMEMPNFYLKFRKDGESWKWDGMDDERTRKEMGGAMEMGAGGPGNRPTIENPDFEGKAFSGKSVQLKEYRGKLVLVDFWGTWCKPCVAELPGLKRIYEVLKPHGFEVIGVAADDRATLKEFFAKKPLPWENIVDGMQGKLVSKFDVFAFPTTLLIDQEGNHVASNLHAQFLLEELATRLKLDAATKKELNDAFYSDEKQQDSVGKADQDLSAKKKVNDLSRGGGNRMPPPRMQVGFSVADADNDEKVSATEMRSYLAERLDGLNVPYDKVFSKLDENADSFLEKSEFGKRHAAIESFVGGVFGSQAMPEDPGAGFQFFTGTRKSIDDAAIMGAVVHRSMEIDPSGKTVDLDAIPESCSIEMPKTSKQENGVQQLVHSTVVLASNGEGFFTAGAVMISADGYALTNYHVAQSLGRGDLIGFTSDGKTHRVTEFIAGNADRDVALIRLEGENFTHVPIASDAPEMGDDIVMMHHTENRFFTYDRGYVMRYPQVGPHEWLEISADYAPGGSGCGIFNSNHELVGLVSMIKFGDGPSLAEEVPPEEDSQSFPGRPGSEDGELQEPPGQERGMIMVKHAVPLSAIRALWKSK